MKDILVIIFLSLSLQNKNVLQETKNFNLFTQAILKTSSYAIFYMKKVNLDEL